ncbi:MAG TPA: helix-turn-helix transcriptional regulator [Gemmatimonadaceae bacterium]|nr:helix-turn-helix transcriptional regulator [Gemmatimonadaceae bacterium]
MADPSELLPLTPVVFHVLVALADGDRHGYAIAREVERVTDGEIRMGPGTLYGSIQRMEASGLIEESAPRAADPAAERRRYYRITAFGRQALRLESERLARMVSLARSRNLIRDGGRA